MLRKGCTHDRTAISRKLQGDADNRRGLVFRLRNGLELRLGDPTDIRLKLAIARAAMRRMPTGTVYVDVSVPGRPVAGNNSQVSGGA